jgi:hypothetical protein
MANVLIALLLIALVALLVSRVHFHFSFNLTISRRGATEQIHASRSRAKIRRAEGGSDLGRSLPAVQSIRDSGVQKTLEAARAVAEGEVASALVNLGCKPQKAREVAKKAIEQGKDFESRVRWAIQNAA